MHRHRTALSVAAILAFALAGCAYASNPHDSTSGGSNGTTGGGGNAASSTQPGDDVTSGGDKGRPCEATFLPSGNTTGIDVGASLKGTLWVRCQTAPTEHHLTLQLEHDVPGAGWKLAQSKVIDKIPPPIWSAQIITTPCQPGEWHLVWSVTGTVGGQPFAGSATGGSRTVEVDDCA